MKYVYETSTDENVHQLPLLTIQADQLVHLFVQLLLQFQNFINAALGA